MRRLFGNPAQLPSKDEILNPDEILNRLEKLTMFSDPREEEMYKNDLHDLNRKYDRAWDIATRDKINIQKDNLFKKKIQAIREQDTDKNQSEFNELYSKLDKINKMIMDKLNEAEKQHNLVYDTPKQGFTHFAHFAQHAIGYSEKALKKRDALYNEINRLKKIIKTLEILKTIYNAPIEDSSEYSMNATSDGETKGSAESTIPIDGQPPGSDESTIPIDGQPPGSLESESNHVIGGNRKTRRSRKSKKSRKPHKKSKRRRRH